MAEKEYIDKVAFNYAIREAVKRYPNSFYNGLEVARQIAHDFPAADVRPVVKAKWVYTDMSRLVCSNCGNPVAFALKEDGWHHGDYCSNCGAMMEES